MREKKRVLIIDDEQEIRDGVSLWLRSDGYQTLTAEDGIIGFETASRDEPDVILLDVLMPRQDGMQTLAALRRNVKTSRIPVVMLSASLRDEQRAMDAGARFFIAKPYEGRKLLQAVNTAVG